MIFEKAPSPPVGKAFVKEIRTIAHTVGSRRPSTVWHMFVNAFPFERRLFHLLTDLVHLNLIKVVSRNIQ